MTDTTQATNTAAQTPHCGVCRKAGAKWLVKSGDREMPVHKPCGKRLAEQAPKGAVVKIVPSEALREEWACRDAEAAAQDFWKDKFQKAAQVRDAKAAKLNGANAVLAQPSG